MGFISSFPFECILVIGFVLYAFYKWTTKNFDFFEKRNIPYEKPFPFFGNSKDVLLQKKAAFNVVLERYEKFKNEKVFGVFERQQHLFGITDPDLIKLITIKDFDHFINRRTRVTSDDDPLLGNSLVFLRDQKWKDMRSTLSPAFTGSKMRLMFELIEEVGRNAIDHLKNEAAKEDPLVIDMRDFFTRFVNDVIGSAAFGIKVNSFSEKDNDLYKMTKQAINFGGFRILFRMIVLAPLKRIMKFFNVNLGDKKFTTYLRELVLGTMKFRSESGIIRPDMIHLLMEARKGDLKHEEGGNKANEGFSVVEESEVGLRTNKRSWSDDDIVAQCFIFLVAGFEPTASTMCFCAHELAENPDIQKKLIEEIDEVRSNLNGNPLTYEILHKMKYLDMVISETLRKWPPASAIERVCAKPYTIYDRVRQRDVHLNPGDPVWIPIAGIHRDPDYYPNPMQFDPERFSEENKHNIKPFTYFPFGVGPRNCIGSRFALMESKAIIFQLLSEFTFEVSHKTGIPLELAAAGFQIRPKNGFWIHLKPRRK